MTKIMIVTEQGMLIKFNSTDSPTQLRGGIGIRGMTVKQGDKVVGIISFNENDR